VCREVLNPAEEGEAAWYPEPWCFDCMANEDERGKLDETIPGSNIRYTLPRYYGTKEQWGPSAGTDEAFEKLVNQLLEGDDDEEGSN
jgi:hypothetical protein